MLGREPVERQQVFLGVFEQLAHLRRQALEALEHACDTLLGLPVALGVEDLPQGGGDQSSLLTTAVHHHVASEMHGAALPRAGEHAGDRGLQSLVLIGDRQPHTGQPATLERSQELCPSLAHAAAQQLARAPRAPDEVAPADDDGADRAGEAFRQAEGRRLHVPQEDRRGRAERDDRVPQACPVDVDRDTRRGRPVRLAQAGVGEARDAAGVGGGERLAHRVAMRVLQHHQRGQRLVGVARVTEGRPDGIRIHRAVRPGGDRPRGRPDHHRVAAGLVDDRVRLGLGDDLAAARHVGHQAHQVAHACRWPRTGRPPCRSARRPAPRAR